MTREEFIEVLDRERYSYKIQGNKIVITYGMSADLRSLESLPAGVEFNNKGCVDLRLLKSLPPGVKFRNEGYVNLESLTGLPPDVEFNNEGYIWLESLIGGLFHHWKGNIEGVNNKRLMNLMISKGLFER